MGYISNRLKQLSFVNLTIRPLYRAAVYPSRRSRALELMEGVKPKKGNKTLWYCGVPVHANLGDIAQKICILDWAKRFFPGHNVIRIPSICFEYAGKEAVDRISSFISSEDVFLFQSGYTMSDRHGDESFHKLVPRLFPDYPLLVMPQTIMYKSKRNLQQTSKAFSCNKRMILLARDSVSYETACRHFSETYSALYPDIVTTLIGAYRSNGESKEGVIFCLRDDSEKFYSPSAIASLINRYKGRVPIALTDTTKRGLNPNAPDDILKKAIDDQICELSKYRVTVTDRFHGMILSLAAGTPVVVLATNDHKVIAGADWFKDEPALQVMKVASLEEASLAIDQLLRRSADSNPSNMFHHLYYNDLPVLLKERGFPVEGL